MEEITENRFNSIFEITIILVNMIVIIAGSLINGCAISVIAKNSIIVGVLSIALWFVIELDRYNNRFLFNNLVFFKRFFLNYLFFAVLSIVFSYIPTAGWIFLFIFVTLGLLSSVNIGIVSGITLLTISILLSDAPGTVFLEYLLPGMVGIVLFSAIDSEFKFLRPMIISFLFQIVFLLIFEVLMVNKEFGIELLIIPLINIILCIPLLLFVLKIFSFTLLYKVTDRMQDVIDPEFELMTLLKNTSKEDYDHAIFTAVLCSKIGIKLSLDESVMKALGYYHRIGIINGDNSWESVREVLKQNDIPEKVSELLKEYLDGSEIKSREIAVLLFADTVISSIKYLFSKNKDTDIDYDKLINKIIDKKLESGILSNSRVSFEDMNIIRNALVDEKLFYDFLR